ncbi:MAG: hypothetical protein TREMPRED_005458 [Tremellales sp. Tagirdzhanova-0007]|nr:MAG: hypothetical protein TREMPRED_005458 [Tremellales sp. Tagirdzhanova-0007]
MSFYLALVSPLDSPLFELALTSSRPPPPPNANSTSTSHPSANASTSSFPSWSTFTGSNGADLGGVGGGELAKGVGGSLGVGVGSGSGSGGGGGGGEKWLCQMVVHKSLDSVEEVMEGVGSLYVDWSVVFCVELWSCGAVGL